MHGDSMEAIKRPQSVAVVLPGELVAEVLSFLAVKSLMRFRCVNKFFNTLISDPHFVQMHLKNSAQNPHLDYRRWRVIGSCNGLICLFDLYYKLTSDHSSSRHLCLWNPATRTQSEFVLASSHKYDEFSFGYDNLRGTYKVVVYHIEHDDVGDAISEMKIFSLSDNYLINIQCFPAVVPVSFLFSSRRRHLSGTINWLVVQDYYYNSIITMEKYVILSLNLSTETFTRLLLPRGFDDEVPNYQPRLVVLMDCLCFCYDFQNTHFVIWQMKDFGEESWIQLYKVGYKTLFSTLIPTNHLFSSLKFKGTVIRSASTTASSPNFFGVMFLRVPPSSLVVVGSCS
ncbi:F-box protein interaction domain protein [Medicago truncatula]|uniref:F-box protein interaction domain protein n=1 Tax=Medicago truncatula TaxID=3880 RepID=G7JKS0_MEDTR|nr:F-box protein interaction domain protein [Medicago truncatula]